MSSVIELYEHNQKAYDALLDMLGERDRACIIKPTGTGKFVIIAKMVQDNPDKRFLLLGTNDYMFNDQMANLAEIAPGFTPENLQFMTYAAAMGMERRNDCVPPYDVIIADEFHHCGAEEWGKGVTHILNANESAKVVGFTATPIRSRMVEGIWRTRCSTETWPIPWSWRKRGCVGYCRFRNTSPLSMKHRRSLEGWQNLLPD